MPRNQLIPRVFPLICPKCHKTTNAKAEVSLIPQQVECENCKRLFSTRIVKVRSRNSGHITKDDQRAFSIRILDLEGNEDLVEFQNPGKENFEFRSGDIVCFTHGGFLGNLKLVQNFTIDRFIQITSNALLGFIAMIILLVVIFWCCYIGR